MHPVTTTLCIGKPNSKGGWFHSCCGVPREEEEEGGRGEPNARYMYVPNQG